MNARVRLSAAKMEGITIKRITLCVGLVPWAKYGALAGLFAGIAGFGAVVLTVRAQRRQKLPIGTLLGFLLTGLAAISLSVFLIFWGLGPF